MPDILKVEAENEESIIRVVTNDGIFAAIVSCFYFLTNCIVLIGLTVVSTLFTWISDTKPYLIIAFILFMGYIFYKTYKTKDLMKLVWVVFIVSLLVTCFSYFVSVYWSIHSIYLLTITA